MKVSRRTLRLVVMSAGTNWTYLTEQEKQAIILLYGKLGKKKGKK